MTQEDFGAIELNSDSEAILFSDILDFAFWFQVADKAISKHISSIF
jgi:hypothetical protein